MPRRGGRRRWVACVGHGVEDAVELDGHGGGVGLIIDRVQQRPHPRPAALGGHRTSYATSSSIPGQHLLDHAQSKAPITRTRHRKPILTRDESYPADVIEVGSRNQPAPPHVLFEALTQPDRDPDRSWLHLLEDEQHPTIVREEAPSLVIWSSIWIGGPTRQSDSTYPPGSPVAAPTCAGLSSSTSRLRSTRWSATCASDSTS